MVSVTGVTGDKIGFGSLNLYSITEVVPIVILIAIDFVLLKQLVVEDPSMTVVSQPANALSNTSAVGECRNGVLAELNA